MPASDSGLEAVVLCGGKGERLRAVVPNQPKSLVEIAGRPFLDWLLVALRVQGIHRVTLATGYLADAIEASIGDGSRLRLQVSYARESAPLGTGGAVRLAMERIAGEAALVLNGDSYCRFDSARLLRRHRQLGAEATIWLQPVADAGRYGAVDVGPDGRIRRFGEKRDQGPGLISAGVYLLSRSVADRIPAGQVVSLERDVFPQLAGTTLYGVVGSGPFLDIGTPASLAQADNLLDEEFRLLDLETKQIDEARRYLDASLAVQGRGFAACAEQVVRAANASADALRGGGKILLCGNGGSAADCQHVATELLGRLSKNVLRPAMAAVALTTDTSFLTAYGNDVSFEEIFARQVEALGNKGDVLVGITTSGNSPNVLRSMEAARTRGMVRIGFSGEGGRLEDMVDHAVIIPDRDTQHVQETMLPLEHLFCLLVEASLYGEGAAPAQ